MIKAVVYESKTGTAKRYAEMFAAKLELACYSIKEAGKQVEKGAEIVFFGWVFANKIQGLKKASGRWNTVCAAAVGMNPPGQTYEGILAEANQAPFPIFYLRGGLERDKLRGLNKMMINMIAEDLEKKNKPEDYETIKLLKYGGNFVSEENLAAIVAFILGKR